MVASQMSDPTDPALRAKLSPSVVKANPVNGGTYVVTKAAPGDDVRWYTATYMPDGQFYRKVPHMTDAALEAACSTLEALGATRADKTPGPPTPEERARDFLDWCATHGLVKRWPEGAEAELARRFREMSGK
jgi:hypothetical protein